MTATHTQTTTWMIDPAHSGAEFSVKHMMVSTVKGHFAIKDGSIQLNETNHAASVVNATIDVSTVETRDAKRDGHLKSGDFFHTEQWPAMTFRSTKIEKTGDDTYKVTGDLTIRDVTKPVVLDVEAGGEVKDAYGKQRRGFEATTTINRKDFGLTWNMPLEGGGVIVSENVKIALDIAAVLAD